MRTTRPSRSAAICIFHSPERWAFINANSLLELLNANAVTQTNAAYGSQWLVAQTIMDARFAKLGAQIDF